MLTAKKRTNANITVQMTMNFTHRYHHWRILKFPGKDRKKRKFWTPPTHPASPLVDDHAQWDGHTAALSACSADLGLKGCWLIPPEDPDKWNQSRCASFRKCEAGREIKKFSCPQKCPQKPLPQHSKKQFLIGITVDTALVCHSRQFLHYLKEWHSQTK